MSFDSLALYDIRRSRAEENMAEDYLGSTSFVYERHWAPVFTRQALTEEPGLTMGGVSSHLITFTNHIYLTLSDRYPTF